MKRPISPVAALLRDNNQTKEMNKASERLRKMFIGLAISSLLVTVFWRKIPIAQNYGHGIRVLTGLTVFFGGFGVIGSKFRNTLEASLKESYDENFERFRTFK